jgi:hypothetical protein
LELALVQSVIPFGSPVSSHSGLPGRPAIASNDSHYRESAIAHPSYSYRIQ